jgi:hypothetical protein
MQLNISFEDKRRTDSMRPGFQPPSEADEAGEAGEAGEADEAGEAANKPELVSML